MEQFNLDKWLKDKSQKVVTREGKDVEIIHTNSPVPHHPIVGFIDKSIYTWTIDGKLIYGKEEQDKNDLFFADEEEELTEFEKALSEIIGFWQQGDYVSKDIKADAKTLLDLARKELRKEQQEKLGTLEMPIDVTEPYYIIGKQGALKELPKWKKCVGSTGPFIDYNSKGEAFLYLNDYVIKVSDLEKLPKEE